MEIKETKNDVQLNIDHIILVGNVKNILQNKSLLIQNRLELSIHPFKSISC